MSKLSEHYDDFMRTNKGHKYKSGQEQSSYTDELDKASFLNLLNILNIRLNNKVPSKLATSLLAWRNSYADRRVVEELEQIQKIVRGGGSITFLERHLLLRLTDLRDKA